MKMSAELVGNVAVLEPAGRVDSVSSKDFGAQLEATAEQAKHVLLDMQAVEFVSSAGLRVLLVALKKLRSENKTLALCNLRPPIQEVLEITGFDRLLVTYADRSSAMAALG